jgi:hypothetical protein
MQATTRCVRLVENCAVWSYCSLDVRNFSLPSHHILIPLFSNVRDRFRRIGMRPRGWTVRLPCTPSVPQITLSRSVILCHTVSYTRRARLLSCWRTDALLRTVIAPVCAHPSTYAIVQKTRKATATLELEPTQHNSLDRLQIRKLKLKTLLLMSAATLKPIRLECYLRRLSGVSV